MTSRSRWQAALVVLGVLLLIPVSAVAWFGRTGDFKERLLNDAREVYAPRQRSTHVAEVLPGSFGEAMLPVLGEIKAAQLAYGNQPQAVQDGCTAVRKGAKPFAELPAACQQDLTSHASAIATVLRATHAQRPELPAAFSPMRAEFWLPKGESLLPMSFAVRMAALGIQQHLARGEGQGAVDDCLDTLAVGRDVSYGGGTIPLLFSLSAVGLVHHACAAALIADPQDAPRIAKQILAIRDAWTPFDRVVLEENLFGEMKMAALSLPDRDVESLPPEARAMIRMPDQGVATGTMEDRLTQTVLLWVAPIGWRMSEQSRIDTRLALAGPPASREEMLTRVSERQRNSWNPLVSLFGPPSMQAFYRRYSRTMSILTMLAATASAQSFRASHSKWPTEADLQAEVPGLADADVTVAASGDELTFTLKSDDSEDPFQIRLIGERKP